MSPQPRHGSISGVRVNSGQVRRRYADFPPDGRRCDICGAVLSRHNEDETCGPCVRSGRRRGR